MCKLRIRVRDIKPSTSVRHCANAQGVYLGVLQQVGSDAGLQITVRVAGNKFGRLHRQP